MIVKNTASGLVRRGCPFTFRPLFGGQLPHKGSLVQPVVGLAIPILLYDGRFLRVTNHEPRATIFHEPRVIRGDVCYFEFVTA